MAKVSKNKVEKAKAKAAANKVKKQKGASTKKNSSYVGQGGPNNNVGSQSIFSDSLKQGSGVAVSYSYGSTRPNTGMRSAAPTRKGAEARIIGCDFITQQAAQIAFSETVYQMDPWNAGSFPRLEAISKNYGKAIFNKLKIICVGTLPTTQGGCVTMAPVYEGSVDALTSIQARNRADQNTYRFWETADMVFNCAKFAYNWYTDNATIVDAFDLEFPCSAHVQTDGIGYVAGAIDLFVEYDIEFCEASLNTDNASPDPRSQLLKERRRARGAPTRFDLVDGIMVQKSGYIKDEQELILKPFRCLSLMDDGTTKLIEYAAVRPAEREKESGKTPILTSQVSLPMVGRRNL